MPFSIEMGQGDVNDRGKWPGKSGRSAAAKMRARHRAVMVSTRHHDAQSTSTATNHGARKDNFIRPRCSLA